tara:strand:+ start:1025 stop:1879 length:855 start_codon:yes stop_codon:yes gene_type:complete
MGAAIMSLGYLSLFYSPPATITWSLAVLIVGNVLENQIGEMEAFRRNGVGYMLRDTNGALYFLPYSDAEDIASLLALQVWMGNTDTFRGIGGALGDLPSTIRMAIAYNWHDLATDGILDLEKTNRFVEDYVETSLDLFDETNRADLEGRINALHDELTDTNDLTEDAELKLATIENGETDDQAQPTDNSAASENDAFDWRAAMAEHNAELPEGVTLIDPVPTMDRFCNEPAETPIWILVDNGGNCSGSLVHKGSGSYEGRSGDWCVWCPDDKYWRSGWGCCLPN